MAIFGWRGPKKVQPRAVTATRKGQAAIPGVHPHTASMIAQAARVPRLASLVTLGRGTGAKASARGGKR